MNIKFLNYLKLIGYESKQTPKINEYQFILNIIRNKYIKLYMINDVKTELSLKQFTNKYINYLKEFNDTYTNKNQDKNVDKKYFQNLVKLGYESNIYPKIIEYIDVLNIIKKKYDITNN